MRVRDEFKIREKGCSIKKIGRGSKAVGESKEVGGGSSQVKKGRGRSSAKHAFGKVGTGINCRHIFFQSLFSLFSFFLRGCF